MEASLLPACAAKLLQQSCSGYSNDHGQYQIMEYMADSSDNNLNGKSDTHQLKPKRSIDACFSSRSVEWYTPIHIVESVLKTLGSVDLDPCSNSTTNPTVPAKTLYTKTENGLDKKWQGRVYMNPPYGREIREWVEKLNDEYNTGNIIEAITLLPARTDTAWFKILRNYPRCFIHGRLKFGNAKSSAPFPSVAIYLGVQQEKFEQVFSELGDVYVLKN